MSFFSLNSIFSTSSIVWPVPSSLWRTINVNYISLNLLSSSQDLGYGSSSSKPSSSSSSPAPFNSPPPAASDDLGAHLTISPPPSLLSKGVGRVWGIGGGYRQCLLRRRLAVLVFPLLSHLRSICAYRVWQIVASNLFPFFEIRNIDSLRDGTWNPSHSGGIKFPRNGGRLIYLDIKFHTLETPTKQRVWKLDI